MRYVLLALPVALALCGCGGRAAAPQARPATLPGDRGRLVAWSGSGAHRLALYAARGPRGVVCTAATLGGGRPRTLACPRAGLEPPLQGYVGRAAGGGRGAYVGVVDGSVGRVVLFGSYPERRLVLAPAQGLSGVRTFAARITWTEGLDVRDRDGGGLLELPSSPLVGPCGPALCTGVVPLVPGGRDRAARLALAQPGLARVLRDHPGWVASEDPWTSCDGRPLGRVVVIRLRDAATFRATVPFVSFPKEPVAYESGVHRILALHARELDVRVDLNTGRVVGVEPDTVAVPLGTVERPRPGGGPDSTDCWSSGD